MAAASPPGARPDAAGGQPVSRAVRWNAVSYAVVGAAGVGLNLAIARFYAPADLGTFNTVLAVFIIAGQVGALGVHGSVLYHAPISARAGGETGAMLAAALRLVLLLSSVTALALLVARPLLARAFGSPDLSVALLVALPGVWLFPLNKVLLNYLNGVHRVRAYATGNAARYVLVLLGIGLCVGMGWPGAWLAGSLSLAEGVLFVALALACRGGGTGARPPGATAWNRRHLEFGLRVMPAGIVTELNTKIDILVLGVLADAAAVGIYSLASIFAEGLYQLVMVLRFSFDPSIAVMIHERRWTDLDALVASGKRLGLMVATGVGILSIAAFPFALPLLLGRNDFDASWPVYAVLVAGIVAASRHIPFTGMLQQAGQPGAQSTMFALVAMANLVGNLLLVPVWGVLGAAAATSLSQVVFVMLLRGFMRRRVGYGL